MQRTRVALSSATLVTAALLSACGGTVSDEYVIMNDPGHVEKIEGSDLGLVTVRMDAVKRLRIQTTDVSESGSLLSVPVTAVFVDEVGQWWVYTNPRPGHYIRHEVSIEETHDARVLLSSGPAAGTAVVTVGAPELYGIEVGVDH